MIGGADRDQGGGQRRFMFRVGKDNEQEALSRPGANIIVKMGGRRMGGMIFVDKGIAAREQALGEWITLALQLCLHPARQNKRHSCRPSTRSALREISQLVEIGFGLAGQMALTVAKAMFLEQSDYARDAAIIGVKDDFSFVFERA